MKFSQFSKDRRMLIEGFECLSEQQKIDCVTRFSNASPREFATIFEQLPTEVRQELDTYNGNMSMLIETSVFDPSNLTIPRRRHKYTPVFVSLLQDKNATLKIHPKFAPLYGVESVEVNTIKNVPQLLDFLHKPNVGPTKQWPTINTRDGKQIKIYHLLKTGQFRVVADHSTDTNVKEGLVSVMYKCLQGGHLTKNVTFTHADLAKQIIKVAKGVQPSIGESAKTLQQITSWLSVQAKNPTKIAAETLQLTLAQASAIYDAYPKAKLDRYQIFDSVRQMGMTVTMMPKDKWNPGDIYVVLPGAPTKISNAFEQINNADDPATKLQILNNLFVHDWGDASRALVSVSLKLSQAQGGKAKDFLRKLTPDSSLYNITRTEQAMDLPAIERAIIVMRKWIRDACKQYSGNASIRYDGQPIVSSKLSSNEKRMREKYASLKLITFMLSKGGIDSLDDTIVSAIGYGLSLAGVNPTFFKLHAEHASSPVIPQKFSAGGAITLYPAEGSAQSYITITDNDTSNNVAIACKIEKGENICDVVMMARSLGYTQVTLEITRIKCSHTE